MFGRAPLGVALVVLASAPSGCGPADSGLDAGGNRSDAGPDAEVADTGSELTDAGSVDASGVSRAAYLTYGFEDRVYRVEARSGAAPEDVSARLERFGTGSRDRWLVPSANGAWLVLSTDRLSCPSIGECLAIAPADLATLEAVRPGGEDVGFEGTPAVGDAGDLVIYASGGGPHMRDVWATQRGSSGWGAATLLTGSSTRGFNGSPALTHDGRRVLFDCGASPYPEGGDSDACEVGVDGSGFRVLVRHDLLPGAREAFVQFPHDSADGVLFQGSWPIGTETPETIWLLPTAGGAPTPIGRALSNAVSPCGLRDGRWGALWLGRPENVTGAHELTLLTREGAIEAVLTPGIDVTDIGVGCGG